MVWGLSVGLREGRDVAERLRGSLVRRTHPRITSAGAFLAGAVVALLLARGVPMSTGEPSGSWVAPMALAALAGAMWGERFREATVLAVAVLVVAGLAVGVVG
jgi:hypothetical protein